MFALQQDAVFTEAEETTQEEIVARIETFAKLFIVALTNSTDAVSSDIPHDSQSFFGFNIVLRSRSNIHELPQDHRLRVGQKRKRRTLLSRKTRLGYSRMWKLLSQFHALLLAGRHVTQRELFYILIKEFGSQILLNLCIQDCVPLLRVPRELLGVYASSRGYVAGCLEWNDGNGWVDLSQLPAPGLRIPGYFPKNLSIRSLGARYILVVEKDGVFRRLIEDGFHKTIPCVLVTACGYPDLSTRRVVHLLRRKLKKPVLCLVDYNPHGCQIFLTYTLGSIGMALEGFKYAVPEMRWVGLHRADVTELELVSTPLSQRDEALRKRILATRRVAENEGLRREIQAMDCKCEIQALNNLSYDFMSSKYLPRKILLGKHL